MKYCCKSGITKYFDAVKTVHCVWLIDLTLGARNQLHSVMLQNQTSANIGTKNMQSNGGHLNSILF
jgi:hypothetical protein